MKTKSIFLFLVLNILILSACQDNALNKSEIKQGEEKNQNISSSRDGISIQTEKKQYTISVDEIKVIFHNASDDKVEYGNVFYLEKKVNEKWLNLKFKENISFSLPAYNLPSFEKKSNTYSLEVLRDKLSPGEYRLVTEVEATPLAAYFEVTE